MHIKELILLNLNDWLSVFDIGGLGEASIPAVRFYTYNMEFNKGYSPILVPEISIDEMPTKLKRCSLSAQDILISLYNLAVDIFKDDFDYDVVVAKKVIKWCSENIHPYNIELIYNSIPNIDDYNKEDNESYFSPRSWYEEKVCEFKELAEINLYTFINDLKTLYEITKTYYGMICFQDDDTRMFQELQTILQFPTAWNKLSFKILEQKDISSNILKEFAESIPSVKICVKYDTVNKNFYIGPKLDSIFDIALYSLIRIIVTNAPNMEDTDTRKTLFICEACGRINV